MTSDKTSEKQPRRRATAPKATPRAPRALRATPTATQAGTQAETSQPTPPRLDDYGAPVSTDAEVLARVAGDITQMSAIHASLTEHAAAIEEAHARYAASSPLALRLEIVGCQWATEHYDVSPGAPNIPTFSWGAVRCHLGKTTPDQDCRDCVHHRITPLGGNEEPHMRRYPRYGGVTPLTEEEAMALAHYLRALNKPPLRRVGAEVVAVEARLAQAREAQAAATRREMERQQGGGR